LSMKTRVVVVLLATMLLFSVAYPVLALLDSGDEQSNDDVETIPIMDPNLEEFLPCTNARYRAWFSCS